MNNQKGLLGAALALMLAGCGGGGGGQQPLTWEPGVFNDPDGFRAQCENPRAGNSPVTGAVYDDIQGSTLAENHWLRAWIHDSYLWYDEVPDLNPGNYQTREYFGLLKTNQVTASGRAKDQFHFAQDTAAWEAQSQSGVSVSYGVDFVIVSATPPRQIVVALVEPGSPADMAGVRRGDRVLSVSGVDVDDASQAGVDILNAGLAPSDIGEQYRFELLAVDGQVKVLDLRAATLSRSAVQEVQIIDTASGPVGYFVFTTHNAPAERQLIDAFEQLAANDVTDLILDLRYNGGGFLAVASEVAYMIAGPRATEGRIFEALRFNNKYPNSNPVTGQSNDPVPFFSTSVGLSVSPGQALPSLDLPRVFVITTDNTCSASESIINSLLGVGVEVIQIGGVTCGKPYGFYPTDNCGTTYFSVQFQSVNDRGFGDYADGFASLQENAPGAVKLPGCLANDDYRHALGDPDEAMLRRALDYRQLGSCSQAGVLAKPAANVSSRAPMIRDAWHDNRIMELPSNH